MTTTSLIASSTIPEQTKQLVHTERLISLWALSEAALGGVLHAFQIPLTGLFINSSAVLFMVLIASTAEKKGTILKATLIVLIVKGIVSPHTPLNAFIAVGFQGLVGEILLGSRKHLLFSSVTLGLVTLLQSAIQKIIVLTLVFGYTLWESIDIFGNFVLNQLPFFALQSDPLDISFWLIAIYISIHLLAGIGIGVLAAKVPGWIAEGINHDRIKYKIDGSPPALEIKVHRKKKNWLQKPSSLLIILLAGVIIVSSYIFPGISKTQGVKAFVMIFRSICIMFLWYMLVGPFLFKIYQKFLKSKEYAYAQEVQQTIQILPSMRYIIYQSWDKSRGFKRFRRIKAFIMLALINILTADFISDENN
jgi:hypothetical protein